MTIDWSKPIRRVSDKKSVYCRPDHNTGIHFVFTGGSHPVFVNDHGVVLLSPRNALPYVENVPEDEAFKGAGMQYVTGKDGVNVDPTHGVEKTVADFPMWQRPHYLKYGPAPEEIFSIKTDDPRYPEVYLQQEIKRELSALHDTLKEILKAIRGK